MKKTIKIFVLGIIITTILMSTVLGSGIKKTIEVAFNSINLTVNGSNVDAPNILYKGTTYVPLRAVGEMLGKNVGWNQETNTASIGNVENNVISKEIAHNILVQKYNFKQSDQVSWYEYMTSDSYAHNNKNVVDKYHIFSINFPYENQDDDDNITSDYNTADLNYCVDKKTGEVKMYDPILGLIEATD